MKESRQQLKADLRLMSEIAVTAVLGKIPRRLRRAAGRTYANAALRMRRGLPSNGELSPTSEHLVKWVNREYDDYVARVDSEASKGNDVGSPTSGPTGGDSPTDSSPIIPDES